jgi:hypothetical protein
MKPLISNASATPALRLRADVVAVVEGDRPAVLHRAHRRDVLATMPDAGPT